MVLVLAAAGCGASGDDACSVAGEVRVNGDPLSKGLVMFMPRSPTPRHRTVSALITDGQFSISRAKSLLPGSYRVAVTAEKTTGRKVPAGEGSSELVDEYRQYIPARYNAQTDLSVEIIGDTDDLLFRLEIDAR